MKTLSTLLQFFPFVIQGIIAVESVLKDSPGQTKKTAVLAAVQAAAQVGEALPQNQSAALTTSQEISTLIDNMVTQLNNSGLFTHSTPATPVTPVK